MAKINIIMMEALPNDLMFSTPQTIMQWAITGQIKPNSK